MRVLSSLFALIFSAAIGAETIETIQLPISPNAAHSRAETYTDADAGFRVTIPHGWMRLVEPEIPSRLVIHSKNAKRLAFCSVDWSFDVQFVTVPDAAILRMMYTNYAEILSSFKNNDFEPRLVRKGKISVAEKEVVFLEFDYWNTETVHRLFNTTFVEQGIMFDIKCNDVAKRYQNSLPEFEAFLSSFQLVNP